MSSWESSEDEERERPSRKRTETESTINYLFSRIPRVRKTKPVKKSRATRDRERFDELAEKIRTDQRTIAVLRAENAALKAEIERCKEKIANYPRMKKQYDRLSRSLSRVAEVQSATLSFSKC